MAAAQQRAPASPGSCSCRTAVGRAPEQRADDLRQRPQHQQHVAALGQAVAVDVREIRPAPQPDHQHEARIGRRTAWQKSGQNDGTRMAASMPARSRARSRAAWPAARLVVADDDRNQHPADAAWQAATAMKHGAPADRRDRPGEAARSQAACRACRARTGCPPASRNARAESACIERERRHQIAGGAEPHQHARGDQPGGRRRHANKSRAGDRDRRRRPACSGADHNGRAPRRAGSARPRTRKRTRSTAAPISDADKSDFGRQIGRDDADRIAQELADAYRAPPSVPTRIRASR